ncbi:MAG: MBL fold metallo-hydrolase [Acidobacteria bacterium]|nr:MBL fold metallo-hydrolase [Acidobacteriota bacterium]
MWTTSAPPFYKNGYVVACERTRQAIVIDPGDDVAEQLAVVKREAVSVTMILLTHAHLDHVTGVGAAKTALGVPVWLHSDDLFLYERAAEQGRMFGLHVNPQPKPDRFYVEGESLAFGDYVVDIRHTRGTAREVCAWRLARPARTAGSCLWATRCLRGRSAGRTCPAVIWTRCSRQSAASFSFIQTRRSCTRATAPTRRLGRNGATIRFCNRGTGVDLWKTPQAKTTSEVVYFFRGGK